MRPFRSLLCWAATPLVIAAAQSSTPADQTAFRQARSITEPAARVQALQDFIAQHPGGALARRATDLELQTLLGRFPERTAAIHTLAAGAVQAAAPGFERWSEEAIQADQLARAGPAGADLSDAQAWAADAVAQMTEDAYHRQMRAMELKYKLPALPAAQRHHDFAHTRASFLAALVNVQLRKGDISAANRSLAEAEKLDPFSSEVSSLKGQVDLLCHEDRAALADFERAEAEGDLKQPWLDAMVKIYREGDADPAATGTSGPGETTDLPPGLSADIDALYARLFPPLYALPPRQLPPGGHTVLLELFTGSGCEPCAAPDLAVESLLGTYGRQDLAVLEYDEHIPRPDPLANPDSVARAAEYRLETTPQAFLDGQEIPVVGASRADVENVVVSFADAIEDRAAVSPGWGISLAVTRDPGGVVKAEAKLAQQVAPAISQAQPGAVAGHTVSAASRRPPLVHFALVEDHVRYSGENGIRFHRMVVRALAGVTSAELVRGAGAESVPVTGRAEASFRPLEIESRQAAYLDNFEKANDRFGEVQFRSKPVTMRPDQLAVVAWLEDAGSHAVLQATYAEVPKP